ncbi:MAG TPA: DUF1592 domain-containing protein [Polyangiaceae bacterium]|nr:DUF1592 domain-containing protein [Polyangiaceae bacterium]
MATIALISSCASSAQPQLGPRAPKVDPSIPQLSAFDRTSQCVLSGPAAPRLQRLSSTDLRNTLRDLFPAASMPSALGQLDGSNSLEPLTGAPLVIERQLDAALLLASNAPLPIKSLTGCYSLVQRSCAMQFVRAFGLRAFRRPLAAKEQTRFQNFFDSVARTQGPEAAARSTVAAFLISPQFTYHLEAISPEPPTPSNSVVLAGYGLASRLSYFVWHTMPDAELLSVAGELSKPETLQRQLTRMLADPRASEAFATYVENWLDLRKVLTERKSLTRIAQWKPESGQAALQESRKFASWVFASPKPTLSTLLLSNHAIVDDTSALLYGLSVAGAERSVELDPAQRAGILTRVAFLAGRAHATASPPLRGSLIVRRVFCESVIPPPGNVNTTLPPLPSEAPPKTNRQRFEQALQAGEDCGGCHASLDSFGYTLENYDGVGAYVTQDMGLPIDARANLGSFGLPRSVNGGVELSGALARSKEVAYCVADTLYGQAFKRKLEPNDWCKVDAVYRALEASGGDFKAAIAAIVFSSEFRGMP